jgi:hypothetical protein
MTMKTKMYAPSKRDTEVAILLMKANELDYYVRSN